MREGEMERWQKSRGWRDGEKAGVRGKVAVGKKSIRASGEIQGLEKVQVT